MTAIGDKKMNRWHLQIADRWIVQYNFYISDQYWGRMFVRMCPYLPFSARVCLNQRHWLANRMREEGIDFQQCISSVRSTRASSAASRPLLPNTATRGAAGTAPRYCLFSGTLRDVALSLKRIAPP
jgi:hypothetical protein